MSSDAYKDKSNPENKATVERVNALSKQIWPEGSPTDEDGVESGGNSEKPLYANVPRPSLPAEAAARWPTGAETFLRQEGHAAGLTDQQVGHFLNAIAKRTVAVHGERETEIKTGFQALRAKWGGDFDRKLAFAQEAVRQFDPRVAALLEKTGLGNAPEFAEVFLALGESRKERGLMVSDVDGIQGEQNILAEMKRLMKSAPYFDSGHKNHADVVAAYNKLSRRRHGTAEHEDD
jgi:hypothetical protein